MSAYFVVQPVLRGGMLLAPLRDAPDEQGWTVGERFTTPPPEPVIAKIRSGYEDAEPRPFLGVPPIMSEALHRVLVAAGVDNLDVYRAILRSADGAVERGGFLAFNLVGLIAAADVEATRFSPGHPSRRIDAAIDSLAIDPARAAGGKMFRLAEQTSAIVVHRAVKEAIEAAGIGPIAFVRPEDFVG